MQNIHQLLNIKIIYFYICFHCGCGKSFDCMYVRIVFITKQQENAVMVSVTSRQCCISHLLLCEKIKGDILIRQCINQAFLHFMFGSYQKKMTDR